MSSANALHLLHKKLFLFPNEFSPQDEAEMHRLKLIVYSSQIAEKIMNMTTPEASSASDSSSNSVQSDYTKNVLSNRFFKSQFENVTFASISPFLDDCKNHLQTAANFHAMFLNFIRYDHLIFNFYGDCLSNLIQ
jgi:hypothetical protein